MTIRIEVEVAEERAAEVFAALVRVPGVTFNATSTRKHAFAPKRRKPKTVLLGDEPSLGRYATVKDFDELERENGS